MVKANMVKNIKKRSASDSEVVEKKAEAVGNLNKDAKKKKTENGTVQNGQANKQVKKDMPKKLKVENKDAGTTQNPNKKQTNAVSLQKNKKPLSPEKKLELLKKRQEYREKRKENRQKTHGLPPNLTIDQLKKKIELIEKRSKLTKTAKRKLAALKKKLKVEEGTYEPKQVAKNQAVKTKNEKAVEVVRKNQVQSNEQKKKLQAKVETKSNKENKKKDAKQSNQLLLKQKNKEEEDDDDDDDDDEDEEDQEVEVEEESSEGEDDSELGEEEEEEEDDDNDDEEEEEEEEDEQSEQTQGKEVKKGNPQIPKEKEAPKNTEDSKKKRYVLFVGNLPYNITNEELKKHFLTKVSQIVDIRIPKKDDNTPRGFAYVELANNTDYEKALSLNHSFVNGRRINVQYSGNDRKAGVAKNFKLHALQKTGRLGGGNNRNNQRFGGYKGKQNNMRAPKT